MAGNKSRPDVCGLGDLTPDPRNARRHSPRNVGLIVDALHAVGAARSIVIDEDGVILAGNATAEAAGEAGITQVRVVEADGHELIAVRRRGLTTQQKHHLALADNRSSELAEGWDPDVLDGMEADGADLSPFFSDDERDKMRSSEKEAEVTEIETGDVQDLFWITVQDPLQEQAVVLDKLKVLVREIEDVTVELGTSAREGWR